MSISHVPQMARTPAKNVIVLRQHIGSSLLKQDVILRLRRPRHKVCGRFGQACAIAQRPSRKIRASTSEFLKFGNRRVDESLIYHNLYPFSFPGNSFQREGNGLPKGQA
jgi:hypothetical protein